MRRVLAIIGSGLFAILISLPTFGYGLGMDVPTVDAALVAIAADADPAIVPKPTEGLQDNDKYFHVPAIATSTGAAPPGTVPKTFWYEDQLSQQNGLPVGYVDNFFY